MSHAIATQEMRYFNDEALTDKVWPQGATIIKVKRADFDNKMSLCLDGLEVIECFSDLEKLSSLKNKVMSLLGHNNLLKYQGKLLELLTDENLHETYKSVIGNLKQLIEDNREKQQLQSETQQKILDGIKDINKGLHQLKPRI